jgi:hypothetical protein
MASKGFVPWNKGLTGIKTNNKGYKHTPEARASMSATRKRLGIKPPSPKGRAWKPESLSKLSASLKKAYANPELRRKISKLQKGERAYWWKGGLTPALVAIRNSSEYKQWRTAVFERDNYTCKMCGVVGGRLNADHIKSFARHPELRFDIENGRTLCVPCHRATDTFGGKSK